MHNHAAPLAPARSASGGRARAPSIIRSHSPGPENPIDQLREMRVLHERLGTFVSGSRLLDDVLLIVAPLASAPEPTYSLSDASTHTGFSAAHLGKLIRAGRIPNHGRKGSPRVKLSECPTRSRRVAKLAVVEEGP